MGSINNFEIITALVTPFKNNKINYEVLKNLIEKSINDNVDGIVLSGTTGESPTLLESEKEEMFRFASKIIKKRIKLFFGVGSNDTAGTIDFIKKIEDIECDGYLVVVPYYNLPSQKGIIEHFKAIASISSKKIIIYNILKRVGTSLDIKGFIELSKVHNIIGVKEASYNYELMNEIKNKTNLKLYVGNDALIKYAYQNKFDGIISVFSILFLDKMKNIILDDDSFIEVIKRMSGERNPALIKALLNSYNYNVGKCRLPLILEDEIVVEEYRKIIEK